MISDGLMSMVSEFAYREADKYGVPSKFQVDITNEKGQWLAERLGAKKKLVLLGTLLMDSQLGVAFKNGKIHAHVEMSRIKAEEILSQDKQITDEERNNILACVSQHHGGTKFLSIEAEICCNADCYKFASIKGLLGSIKSSRDMDLEEMIKLYNFKADEKWQALSLDICKKDLESDYKAIKTLLSGYHN